MPGVCLFNSLLSSVAVSVYDFTAFSTGSSKRNGAKFRELSLNFPKLADWLCMGWPSCLAALGREFSNRGTFLLHDPVCGFSMMEQVSLCPVWLTENWLGSSINHIQGWKTV